MVTVYSLQLCSSQNEFAWKSFYHYVQFKYLKSQTKTKVESYFLIISFLHFFVNTFKQKTKPKINSSNSHMVGPKRKDPSPLLSSCRLYLIHTTCPLLSPMRSNTAVIATSSPPPITSPPSMYACHVLISLRIHVHNIQSCP